MEELYKFMNMSNATLDLKVGNEVATEEGEPIEVLNLLCLWYCKTSSPALYTCPTQPANQPALFVQWRT